ncbi:MAG: uracil-DNA glycosylase [Chloroflexota bacterium]
MSLTGWEQSIPLMRSGYHHEMLAKVEHLRQEHTIYPPQEEIFNALILTPFDQVRAVILGQDPYHGPGQAHGLSFSVLEGIKKPPSLRNIFKEIGDDIYGDPTQVRESTNLSDWAEQGVLLLNTYLTVVEGNAGSHRKLGWAQLTSQLIEEVSRANEHIVFMLWGKPAQKNKALIQQPESHLILESAHPSPLSARRGFFGCKHFSQANAYLEAHGRPPIQWA